MPQTNFPVDGLIGERWLQLLAEDGPLGSPVGPEMDLTDSQHGRQQRFEHGTIAWMPDQEMVLSVFQLHGEAVFDWSVTRESQLHYDYFRIDVLFRRDPSQPFTGTGHANLKLKGFKLPELLGARRGTYCLRLQGFGEYVFKVKGVDAPGLLSGETSVQGWTPLIPLTVSPVVIDPPDHAPDDPLINERWHLFGATEGPFGRMVDGTSTMDDGVRRQAFDHGVITTYPQYGPRAMLGVYQDATSVHVYWGYTDFAPQHAAGQVEYDIEAFNLDIGQGAEFKQRLITDSLEWLTWAHHGFSSGYTRFHPVRDSSVPWDQDSTRNYLIRITDPVGHQLSTALKFRHRPVAPALDRPALDGSPEHAAASHGDRMDAVAEHYVRTNPIDLRNVHSGEDITFQLIAHLHMVSKQRDYCCEGQARSTAQIAAALRQLTSGPMGTNADHDATVKGLLTILLRYREHLTEPLIIFVIEELVPRTLRGRHDPQVEIHSEIVAGFKFNGPETENHILMIETSRFLVNQILFERTHDEQFNSLDLGLTDWLMNYLHTIAKHDFLEFNSRPYNRYSIHALLNLCEFSTDPPLRTAARHVLDYLAVKFAVSSSRHRHLGPFRRRRENVNAPNNALNGLLWKEGHPMTGFALAHFGPLAPDGTPWRWFDANWLPEALIFGAGSYRAPAAAYIVAMADLPPFQHSFYHGSRPIPAEGEQPDGGVEIYYKSPSFLLTAGGMFLNSGSGSDNVVMQFTGTNGCALAQSTTLLPRHADPFFADLVRFDTYTERGVNTGVHEGFACGGNLRIPGIPDTDHGWIFLNESDLGYYVAAYRTVPGGASLIEPLDNHGFIYVLELRTAGRPDDAAPMTFDEFKTRTVDRNQLPDPLAYAAAYQFTAPDDRRFTFRMWAEGEKYRPRILFVDGEAQPESFGTNHLVEGPFLNAPNGHDGFLHVRHPYCDTPLVLDFRNHRAPRRGDNSDVCPQWHSNLLKAYFQRAHGLFSTRNFGAALSTTRASIDEFRRARADNAQLGVAPELEQVVAEWLAAAFAAHPHDIPAQLAAARNTWEITSVLAKWQLGSPHATDEDLERSANTLRPLIGLLTFGTADSAPGVRAAELTRSVYERMNGDHRIDIARVWTDLAQRHHETGFWYGHWAQPPNPDLGIAELAKQREAAHSAAELAEPIAEALPDPDLTTEDLLELATILWRLIGLLTHGASDMAPGVRAAELAVRVYQHLPGEDHRIDIARVWTTLAQRHHETGYWYGHWAKPPNPDLGNAELAKQREAAREAAVLANQIVAELPALDGGRAELTELADLMDRLVGMLTNGAPAGEPQTLELESLADETRRSAEQVRTLLQSMPQS